MAIPINRYVNIVSAVGGASNIVKRDLSGLIFTTSQLVSPDAVMEFTGDIVAGVRSVFGPLPPPGQATFDDRNLLRAQFYARYVSPSGTVPRKLSYARFVDTSQGFMAWGGRNVLNLAALKQITAGDLFLVLNGAQMVTGPIIDFSAATDFNSVATTLTGILNTSFAAWLATVPMIDGSPALFSARWYGTSQRFVIVGPTATIPITVSVQPRGTGDSDVATALGMFATQGGIMVSGAVAETPAEAFERTVAITDNFGSFCFDRLSNNAEYLSVAQANADHNVSFVFAMKAFKDGQGANAPDPAPTLSEVGPFKDYAGTGITLVDTTATLDPYQFSEMIPMAIGAAADYTKANGAPGFMYRQYPGAFVAVSSAADADACDVARVNYYGRTKKNGQPLDFYQRGLLTGGLTAPVDMNVYFNEMWLKDDASNNILDALRSLERIPANASGVATVRSCLQPTINAALRNGVISVGKELTLAQRLFISQKTNDANAWQQVQNIGYWLDVVIESYGTIDDRTEYKAVYTLIYSKDDAIRAVDGTHSLV